MLKKREFDRLLHINEAIENRKEFFEFEDGLG